MVVVSYLLIVIFCIGWAVGFLGFHPGKEIHLLLVLALVTASGIVSRKDFAPNAENRTMKNA
jgi:hypothetical protein